MSLIYKQGNIINALKNGEINVVFHQCNCTVGLGAGIALALANEFPELRNIDKKYRDNNDTFVLGAYSSYTDQLMNPSKNWFTIVNLYAQYNIWMSDPLDNYKARLIWLKRAMSTYIRNTLGTGKNYGCVLMGSGLAADPKLKVNLTDLEYFKLYVAPTIEEVMDNFDVSITVYYL